MGAATNETQRVAIDPHAIINTITIPLLRELAAKKPALNFSLQELASLVALIKKGAGRGTEQEIKDYVCETVCGKATRHHKYDKMAGRLSVYFVHQRLEGQSLLDRFKSYMKVRRASQLVHDLIEEHLERVANEIDYDRDYQYGYFGYRTFRRLYIGKHLATGVEIEAPQDVFMGIALSIHRDDLEKAIECYHDISKLKYTFATPTLLNARCQDAQMSSCFLLGLNNDSISGMYRETIPDLADISAKAGGMSLHISSLRCKGSVIAGSGGKTSGIIGYLKTLESLAIHVNQGAARKGALAIYMSDWHADMYDFIEAGSKHGNMSTKAPNLFYAMWTSDLFMKRSAAGGKWSFFNSQTAKDLDNVYGEEFEKLYEEYEAQGLAVCTVDARDFHYRVISAQVEQGGPYLLYKDHCNRKANQSNLGTIKSSNLCCEVIQFSGIDRRGEKCTSVCNLSSVSLPYFVTEDGDFDHYGLAETVKRMVQNIDKIIDLQVYPTVEARRTNMKTRNIGIGIQGLADVFLMMGLSMTSEKARTLNREIAETMYHAALTASCDLAKKSGPYESYDWDGGSYLRNGKFHWELALDPSAVKLSGRWDWEALRADIAKFGVRNSQLLANMPTASTSQIMGNNECFEPYTSNVYTREVLMGKFTVVNRHLIDHLEKKGLWNKNMAEMLIKTKGSVQSLPLDDDIKVMFRTAHEIDPLDLIEMDADRQHFIDQSQSSNRYVANPTAQDIINIHFKAWALECKTGGYYFHTKAVNGVNQVPLYESNAVQKTATEMDEDMMLEIAEGEMVEMKTETMNTEEHFDGDKCCIDDGENHEASIEDFTPISKNDDFDGDVCRMEEGCLVCGS